MARPYWSGQIRISLVSFGVKLFPAVESKSQIRFHQISRSTGERVRHQKVSGSDEEPVQGEDIVKGYEYSKGEYIRIEPEEIEHLRIASRQMLEIQQFASSSELDASFFEKPYFVVPENDAQAEAFGVIRKALQITGKVGIGKIAVGGREVLFALGAPADTNLAGMMGYSMRYAAELRSAAEYFSGIKAVNIDEDQLALAKELIERKTAKFDPSKYKDEYEDALRAMVEAKLHNLPVPVEETQPTRGGKVIDLMEALRKSVAQPAEKKPVARATPTAAAAEADKGERKHGLKVVTSRSKSGERRRKSA